MGNLKDNAEALQANVQALLETQAEYYKLWSFKVGMKSVTLLIHAIRLRRLDHYLATEQARLAKAAQPQTERN